MEIKIGKIIHFFINKITKFIYQHVGLNKNPFIARVPYYLGLLPYEMYVLPGMFVALVVMFYYQSFTPVQVHLLPHWFAFSIALYLKTHLKRVRPGCVENYQMNHLLDAGHCEGKTRYQSFPSGHTIIAFALATSLILYLRDDTIKDKKFLGIDFNKPVWKYYMITKLFFVAIMISIHRVSYGYHFVGDVIVGAILGMMIGFTSHTICNTAREIYIQEESEKNTWDIVRVIGSLFAVFAFIHFFSKDFHRLSALQH